MQYVITTYTHNEPTNEQAFSCPLEALMAIVDQLDPRFVADKHDHAVVIFNDCSPISIDFSIREPLADIPF